LVSFLSSLATMTSSLWLALSLALAFLAIAYLLGSLPSGYWAGQWLQGIDIRQVGSGSTGATNVLRTLGKKAAIAVLSADILKGVLAVALVRLWFAYLPNPGLAPNWEPWLLVVAALGAIIGHSKSFLLHFSGGKSVATGLGVLLMLNPWVALGTLATFLLSLALSRIVSLSSILAAIAVNGFVLALHQPLPYLMFTILAGVYVIVRHQGNIQRLWAGTEPRLGEKLVEDRSP
jgi:glycerol-3-phosphate acyltransferase PlsY